MANGFYTMYSYTGYKQGTKYSGWQKATSKDELTLRLSRKGIKLLTAKKLWSFSGGIKNKEIIRFFQSDVFND